MSDHAKQIKTVIENLMEQYRYAIDSLNNHQHVDYVNWDEETDLPSYEEAKELLNELQSQPSPISTQYSSGAIHSLGEFPATAPMSAEQVEILKLSAHFLNEYGGELSNNTCNDTDSHVRDTINRIGKDKFMKMVMDWGSDDCEDAENYDWIVVKVLAHYIKQLTSTTPSIKSDGCEHDCVAKDMYWKKCHKCGMILPIN